MKHSIWSIVGVGAVVIVAATLASEWSSSPHQAATEAGDTRPAETEGLPWQVEVLPDGTSRVMGLHPGADTLSQVRDRTAGNLQVALVARLGEVGALEALADPFNAAFISGRLVLSFAVPADTRLRWREASTGSSPMEGGARRFELRADHLAEADQAVLAGLSFIPTARLTEADIRQRFGPPESERTLAGGGTVMFYPKLGMAATVAPGQRVAIQYVAPREAERLLSPTESGSTASATVLPNAASASAPGRMP